MVSYNVQISPTALNRLNNYIDYIHDTLMNDQAADNVLLDALDTITELQSVAGSLGYCDHPELKKRGIRKIIFLKHDYVMLYSIIDNTVEIKAIYHLLQDYENTFITICLK